MQEQGSGVGLCDVEVKLRALCGGHHGRNLLTKEHLCTPSMGDLAFHKEKKPSLSDLLNSPLHN